MKMVFIMFLPFGFPYSGTVSVRNSKIQFLPKEKNRLDGHLCAIVHAVEEQTLG